MNPRERRLLCSAFKAAIDEEKSRRGTITTAVYGSHVHVTVRPSLWGRLLNWAPDDRQFRRLVDVVSFAGRLLDDCLKAAVILTMFYLAIEIGAAFLPGGAVHRVLHPPQDVHSCARIGDPVGQAECVLQTEREGRR